MLAQKIHHKKYTKQIYSDYNLHEVTKFVLSNYPTLLRYWALYSYVFKPATYLSLSLSLSLSLYIYIYMHYHKYMHVHIHMLRYMYIYVRLRCVYAYKYTILSVCTSTLASTILFSYTDVFCYSRLVIAYHVRPCYIMIFNIIKAQR